MLRYTYVTSLPERETAGVGFPYGRNAPGKCYFFPMLPPAILFEIESDIEAVEQRLDLPQTENFTCRWEAIDDIEFNILDRIEGLLHSGAPMEGLAPLKERAERVKRRLEDIDHALFERIREDIRTGGCRGASLQGLLEGYAGRGSSGGPGKDGPGYDCLDALANGLLLAGAIPPETRAREPEMVYYQKTPVRIVFEMAEKARLTGEDVFFDLGSGLGQVPILVHLLSGTRAYGVEFEPAYCGYAKALAEDLNLSGVEFLHADARAAEYSRGTVFFMYTPFEGQILQAVLEKLREDSLGRRIRIFTYGPCTIPVSGQSWLRRIDRNGDDIFELGEFASL